MKDNPRFEALLCGLNYWAIYDNEQHHSVAFAYSQKQVEKYLDMFEDNPSLAAGRG